MKLKISIFCSFFLIMICLISGINTGCSIKEIDTPSNNKNIGTENTTTTTSTTTTTIPSVPVTILPASFVTVWKTDNLTAGSSIDKQIKLPLESEGTYNFTVNWGDGSSNTITVWNSPDTTHTYATKGEYQIVIDGSIKGFRFNYSGDRSKIINIKQWGNLNLGNNGSYFYGCEQLQITALDILNLNGTFDLSYAFSCCISLTSAPSMNSWDTSDVINMSYLFFGTNSFNQDIGNWTQLMLQI